MKGIVVKTPWLFKYILKGYAGITLFPFIFIKKYNVVLETHEQVHINQQKKYFVIGFYIRYLAEYLYYLIKHKNHRKAYYSISFEKEAYSESRRVFELHYKDKE